MATTVENGKGGVVSVTATESLIRIVPAPGTDGHFRSAMTLKVWNTGSNTVYATVNEETQTEADAIPIPSGESFWFVGQPIKKLILACTTGETSTANYGAY